MNRELEKYPSYGHWRSQDFSTGGLKQGSEATERGEGVDVPPPAVGRFLLLKFRVSKWHLFAH